VKTDSQTKSKKGKRGETKSKLSLAHGSAPLGPLLRKEQREPRARKDGSPARNLTKKGCIGSAKLLPRRCAKENKGGRENPERGDPFQERRSSARRGHLEKRPNARDMRGGGGGGGAPSRLN